MATKAKPQRRKSKAKNLPVAPRDRGKRCKAIYEGDGKQCTHPAVRGGEVCRWHGGYNVKKKQMRIQAENRLAGALIKIGVAVEINPTEALVHCVYEAAGNVAFYRGLVQQLMTHPEAPHTIEELISEVHGVKSDRSIYGPNHLGEGAMHVLVKAYDKERERLAMFSKMAIDAGIAERQIKLAERQGELLVRVILAVIEDPRLKLNDDQRALGRKVAGEQLRSVAAIDIGGSDDAKEV